MMGIKHLLKLISKMKKPLVGHNCGLDILILSNQFFKPLPGNSNYICLVMCFPCYINLFGVCNKKFLFEIFNKQIMKL